MGVTNEKMAPRTTDGVTLFDLPIAFTVDTSPKLLAYLNACPQEAQKIICATVAAIALTRKSGRVAASIVEAEVNWWKKYRLEQVLAGMQTYLQQRHALQGRRENYLRGIIRNGTRQGLLAMSPQLPSNPATLLFLQVFHDRYHTSMGSQYVGHPLDHVEAETIVSRLPEKEWRDLLEMFWREWWSSNPQVQRYGRTVGTFRRLIPALQEARRQETRR